nr:LLM class flavin-dependent oxidoreductase [Streptomyces sp. MMG1121]
MHLAVRGPVGGDTVEHDADVAFAAVERLARVAERGLFDFLLFGVGPVGRPEPIAVLNALAGVTARLGLAGAVDGADGEPYELGRRLATLDHLSAGRAGWWDSGMPEGVPHPVGLPRCPQGRPVVIRAGESERAREAAAASADVLVVPHGSLKASRARYADVKRRLAAYGRAPEDLKVMAGVSVVPGDPTGEASFGGTPEAVAAGLDLYVREGAVDGFLLAAHVLEEFVDRVVPLLQERGAFRREYAGTTLRSHLGVPEPVRRSRLPESRSR